MPDDKIPAKQDNLHATEPRRAPAATPDPLKIFKDWGAMLGDHTFEGAIISRALSAQVGPQVKKGPLPPAENKPGASSEEFGGALEKDTKQYLTLLTEGLPLKALSGLKIPLLNQGAYDQAIKNLEKQSDEQLKREVRDIVDRLDAAPANIREQIQRETATLLGSAAKPGALEYKDMQAGPDSPPKTPGTGKGMPNPAEGKGGYNR